MQELEKCKRIEGRLEALQKKGEKLQEELRERENFKKSDKENICLQNQDSKDQTIPKEARIAAKTLRQLEEKSLNLSKQIEKLYQHIENYE